MTSKLTRERLQEIAEDGFLKHGESKELARMALAEKGSEPVLLYRERNPYNGLTTGWQELTENEFSFLKENAGENAEFLTLYRHAPPAPVVPDSYVMVPMRLTAENGAKGALSGEFSETKFVNCPECFGDDECETCDGSGRIEITVPVTWTTIKEIWAKGVEHFAAAPQEVK
ncbi:hypothetical protein [Klebsiella pneumoniae]|uniref:hypothetical protein n=1 Tax=Klebsiella pneumoniae TaxID=573 RepID=UPI001CA54E58|nr:hypothetical protein [Klebsiella pneumoniae]MBW6028413.1 hypothetical protein [Klebsiella pneumoniae]